MEDPAKSKDRSPNYPSIGLEVALNAVKKLYAEDHQSPVPLETLAKFAGHAKMSGPARSKLAAIRQYGLIDSAGSGKIKVSERALPLFFHQPNEREYQQTLKDLALSPPLFGQLFSQYAQASENTLRLHLARDRKFSDDGAKKLARIFKETLAFAKLTGPSYNEQDAETVDEAQEDFRIEPVPAPFTARPSRVLVEAFAGSATTAGDAPNFPLPDGLAAKIFLTGAPTKRALLRLAQRVKEWADDLPAPDPRSADERARIAEAESGAAF